MFHLIHAIFHEPVLYGATIFSVLLIAALKFGDWRDKRREREMLALRARLKEQRRKGRPTGDAVAPAAVSGGGFRIFRWQFVLVALAIGFALIPVRMQVNARSRQPLTAKASAARQILAASTDAKTQPPVAPDTAVSPAMKAAAQPGEPAAKTVAAGRAPEPIVVSAARTGWDGGEAFAPNELGGGRNRTTFPSESGSVVGKSPFGSF